MTVDSIDNAAFSIDHASSNSKVEEINDAPIELVRLTVPITDDPTLPCITFRTWFLGITSCALLAFLGQFFGYCQNPLSLSSVCIQIVVLPIGKIMAATLPMKSITIPFTNRKMNIGDISKLSRYQFHDSSGEIWKCHQRQCHRKGHFILTVLNYVGVWMMLGYGWAGLFRKYLVDSPYMWWPSNLVQVSLFRALHEVERRPKGGLTRLQLFLAVLVASFSYYVIPCYFFPSITSLSLVCWIWKDSITAQQIGSGLHVLGVGSFAFDWNIVASFLGSTLTTPAFAIVNILAGFFLIVYVCIPISYWNNIYEAEQFPIYSSHVFTSIGQSYNLSRAFNADTFQFDQVGYDAYSPVYLSIFFAFAYGLSFATLIATLSHVALFHGKTIAKMWRQTRAAVHDNIGDVHNRLMRSYEPVHQWWFYTILFIMVSLALIACEGFGRQLRLPYWGILLACALALFFTLPIGIIAATTNQLVGTVVASSIYFGTSWWLLTTVENICDPSKLPDGSPWTCPSDDVFYNASIIWGVIGPLRMFGALGVYVKLNWFFLIGLLAPVPVCLLTKIFPEKRWIRLINMPVILGATMNMPPARAINYIPWGAVGIFFNCYIYRKYKSWWARHNYILSAGLDAGIAFMALLAYVTLQSKDINGVDWWGLTFDDHCPLATCPTAPGVVAEGCPVQ
ncbi:hypothetical protein MKW92_041619 [Papaver armeniacum]|nr:hypothetical protein MKW92_041619 [Papaver armeniacum]